MKSKWLILIIIIFVIAMTSSVKKEARYGFRCSEDNSSIEIFNKESNKFVVYEQCGEEGCEVSNGIPECKTAKKEEPDESQNYSWSIVAAIVLLFIFWKRFGGNKK